MDTDYRLSEPEARRLHAALSAEARARNRRAGRVRRAAQTAAVAVGAGVVIAFVAVGGLRNPIAGTDHDPRTAASPTTGVGTEAPTGPGSPIIGLAPRRWSPRLERFGGGAVAVSLRQAGERAGFAVVTPGPASLVSDSAIRKVWFLPRSFSDGVASDVVALEYARLEIVEQQMPESFDAPAVYRRMVAEKTDPGATTVTVDGVLAYLSPPYTDDGGLDHPGYLAFTRNGVQTSLEGWYTADELVRIAASMHR